MKSFIRTSIVALILAVLSIPSVDARDAHRSQVSSQPKAAYRAGTVILKLRSEIPNIRGSVSFGQDALDAILARIGAYGRRALFPMAPYGTGAFSKIGGTSASDGFERVYVIQYSGPFDAMWVSRELQGTGATEYAEPYWIFSLDYNPSDPQYAQQYALSIIKAAEAWDVTRGDTSVVIGIVDSGVEWSHVDLIDNIWINPGEDGKDAQGRDKRTNGVDDDGNGKIDDYHGWDFVGGPSTQELQAGNFKPDNDPTPVPANVQGYEGYHGTWTSGCAAAATDNGKGVAGVGFRSRILPVKCSDDTYATGQVISGYDGIIYAADMGAKVINCSFGGEANSGFVQSIQQIADYAYSKGALIVASAGNFGNNNDVTPYYPAGLNHVLSVGASTSLDSAASFTHYGMSVHTYAPGVNILTTHLGNQYVGNGVSGTSFSSPIVAGVAALVWAMHPDWRPDQVAMQVRVTGDRLKIPSPAYAPFFYRRVNAYRAVNINKDLTSGSLSNMPGLDMISFSVNGKKIDTIRSLDDVVKVSLTLKNYLAPTRNLRITSLSGQVLTLGSTVSVPTIGTLETATTDQFDVKFDAAAGVLYSEGSIPLYIQFTDGAYEQLARIEIPISLPGWHKQLDPTLSGGTTTYAASSIDAVSTKIAWVAANAGSSSYYTRTFNGQSWTSLSQISSTQEPIYCITGLTDKIAFGGTGPTSGQAAIYKTTNGGGSWTKTSVASITGFVNAIHFFDDQNGIFFGDPLNGRWGIGVTSDGGTTWKALGTPLTVASSTEVGWNNSYGAFGDNVWFGTNNSRIYRSSDRGQTWSSGTTPTVNSFGVAFADAQRGLSTFSVGSNNTGGYMIARTSNGGATWSEATPPFPGTQPQSVTFIPGTTRALVGTQTGVYETSDFGATWKQMATPVITYSGLMLSAQSDTARNVSAFGANVLTQIMNLKESPTPDVSSGVESPQRTSLAGGAMLDQNVPNPFSESTTIRFELTSTMSAELVLHDALGRRIRTLAEGTLSAGPHSVTLESSELASGTYYYTLTLPGGKITRQLVVVR